MFLGREADLLVAGVDNEGPSLYFMVDNLVRSKYVFSVFLHVFFKRIYVLCLTSFLVSSIFLQGLPGKFSEGEQGTVIEALIPWHLLCICYMSSHIDFEYAKSATVLIDFQE